MASVAGSAPHERLEALHRTREEELAKAHEHVRATQWAFAHASMVAAYDEWEQDGDDDDGDWEDWGEDSPAASEPGTPDWRGVSASVCSVNPPRVPVVFLLVYAHSPPDLTCPWLRADQFDKILDEDSERAKKKRDRCAPPPPSQRARGRVLPGSGRPGPPSACLAFCVVFGSAPPLTRGP